MAQDCLTKGWGLGGVAGIQPNAVLARTPARRCQIGSNSRTPAAHRPESDVLNFNLHYLHYLHCLHCPIASGAPTVGCFRLIPSGGSGGSGGQFRFRHPDWKIHPVGSR